MTGKILIIDDEPSRVQLLRELLSLDGYSEVAAETDSAKAWERFLAEEPDLVLLDLHMSPFDGFAVLQQLKPLIPDDAYLPIIVLTGDTSREVKQRALEEGAIDFISKPFDTTEILLRVRNQLRTRRLYLELEAERASLESRIRARTEELAASRLELLERLARTAEYRDDNTGDHIQRVGRLAESIAQELGLPHEQALLIGRAALLHDIGKIGLSDQILMKPGKLTPEEFEKVKEHTRIGAAILAGSRCSLIQTAETIARYHHERWDGSGYEGLRGEDIPLEARIVAVADVYDALRTKRSYKDAWSDDAALGEIEAQSGRQFDPVVVSAFLGLMKSEKVCMAA